MKIRFLLLLSVLLAALVWLVLPAPALASDDSGDPAASALCMPGIYSQAPGDCLPAGPSAYLTQMAQQGITFPLTPLPATAPDPSLVEIDVRYGEVHSQNAPIYNSLEAAMEGNRKSAFQYINAEFAYISYAEDTEYGGKRFYQIDLGQWMRANDVSRVGVLPKFQGLVFSDTPKRSFGWVLTYMYATEVQSRRTPGENSTDFTGHVFNLYDVVQIYAVKNVDGADWYLVGPDEWIPKRVVPTVTPNTTPPEGVSGDRWIDVNLLEQTLAVYEKGKLVYATLVATGAEPFWTQPGVFQIKEKLEKTPMSGGFDGGVAGYYLEDVPWTMYYDGPRALHGAYWRAKLGFPQSHGCVNLTIGDAHWLFDWANVGDWVHIWDPSGATPTDPSLYSSGGY